uniref:GST N-terminal domain-containing protein n=1 Tax=Fibrocapsa japonica TaxID=94617 RepID=A0A7S2XX44_9STRA|mmetsp:Transcript_18014/g.26222  ORF Transcript_18014/g.26222 Transcript_18014/m.26222 type:complete len:484 (+) Transcript_18014:43-1494(+)
MKECSAMRGLVLLALLGNVNSFSSFIQSKNIFQDSASSFRRVGHLFSTVEDAATKTIVYPPSWEDLYGLIESTNNLEEKKPLLTLYRDTNGWCPFCERVWLITRVKNIPCQEVLVNLKDKPAWFTSMVPTGLVPAVLIHEDLTAESKDASEPVSERKLVWESLDIMKALDQAFPDSPRMVYDSREYEEAAEILNTMSSDGFKFVYQNSSLSNADKIERKMAFNTALDNVDSLMKKYPGSFILGKEFTGLDAIAVPMLERWRHQLPLSNELDILAGRDGISAWFDAMDSFAPYKERVAGDKYSWSAVTSFFLKIFGSGSDPSAETLAAMERAEKATVELMSGFSSQVPTEAVVVTTDIDSQKKATLEAAKRLILNHNAVIADCTNPDPKTQADLNRATDDGAAEVADIALRALAASLLNDDSSVAQVPPELAESTEKSEVAAKAMRVIAGRLCVPRDMGAPAAGILRRELMLFADCLNSKCVQV